MTDQRVRQLLAPAAIADSLQSKNSSIVSMLLRHILSGGLVPSWSSLFVYIKSGRQRIPLYCMIVAKQGRGRKCCARFFLDEVALRDFISLL